MTRKNEQTEKIRLALAGRSPRQVGEEKAFKALSWVYKWGWSSSKVLGLLCNDNQNGLAARLVKRGFLIKTRTESGGGCRDIPAFIFTLTEQGIAEVERHLKAETDLLEYDTNPLKIKQTLLRHDNLAQFITANSLIKENISDFLTPALIKKKSESGVKQPDVIWLNNGKKYAVEVELTGKWQRNLDMFILAVLTSLLPRKDGETLYDKYFIVSDSEAILSRYKTAFKPGTVHDSWQKNTTRHWVKNGTFTVPNNIEGKLAWRKIDYK